MNFCWNENFIVYLTDFDIGNDQHSIDAWPQFGNNFVMSQPVVGKHQRSRNRPIKYSTYSKHASIAKCSKQSVVLNDTDSRNNSNNLVESVSSQVSSRRAIHKSSIRLNDNLNKLKNSSKEIKSFSRMIDTGDKGRIICCSFMIQNLKFM